jgi:hypothetical protein
MKKFNKSTISISFVLFVMIFVSSNFNWGKESWTGILEADAKGYYAYLPAVFIYKDLNFTFFDYTEKVKYYNKNLYYDYRIGTDSGKTINKYFCGTALAEAPFFLLAHFLSYLNQREMDGFSSYYTIFVSVAALVYLTIGLIFMNLLLKLFEIKAGIRAFVLPVAVFGTNLFYYTVSEPGMSHIYSFAFVCMFAYYAKKYFITYRPRLILVLAALLGMIVLIRPVNGLIFFLIPFLASDLESLKKGFKEAFLHKFKLVLAICIGLGIISIQLIYYKLATGDFLVYAYGKEGFNFLNPHFFAILFSYKKGLFLYTPIYLLSLVGLISFWKTSKFQFYAVLFFLVFLTYILSSWWMWYYGGSFSSRVFIEFIPIFMLLLAVALQSFQSGLMRKTFLFLVVGFTLLCQIQTYQYRYYVIHWVDMNQEKYWQSYLRIGEIFSKK